jgi:hypothetical protein
LAIRKTYSSLLWQACCTSRGGCDIKVAEPTRKVTDCLNDAQAVVAQILPWQGKASVRDALQLS